MRKRSKNTASLPSLHSPVSQRCLESVAELYLVRATRPFHPQWLNPAENSLPGSHATSSPSATTTDANYRRRHPQMGEEGSCYACVGPSLLPLVVADLSLRILQLIPTPGGGDKTYVWGELSDGEHWIDCCFSQSAVERFEKSVFLPFFPFPSRFFVHAVADSPHSAAKVRGSSVHAPPARRPSACVDGGSPSPLLLNLSALRPKPALLFLLTSPAECASKSRTSTSSRTAMDRLS
jgi:hypothetical protein